MVNEPICPDALYVSISKIIQQARQQVKQAVNHQMVQAYWHIGRLIVEQEQSGQERAEYGKKPALSAFNSLDSRFWQGF